MLKALYFCIFLFCMFQIVFNPRNKVDLPSFPLKQSIPVIEVPIYAQIPELFWSRSGKVFIFS